MEIRLARVEDLDALTEIEADADLRYAESAHPEFAGGSTIPRAVLERAIGRQRIIVAEEDARVQGFVLLTRSEDEMCIGQISVRRAVAGRGVGAALLRTVAASARGMGYRSIVLNTQTDVPWNRPWYERHGYVVVEPEDWTPDMHVITREQTESGLDWATRVHMRLVLDP